MDMSNKLKCLLGSHVGIWRVYEYQDMDWHRNMYRVAEYCEFCKKPLNITDYAWYIRREASEDCKRLNGRAKEKN